MKKKYLLGAFAVLASAMLGVSMVSANGFQGILKSQLSEEDLENNQIAVNDAIETGDYASWEALMEERIAMMEDLVSEETFELLQEEYQNREEYQEALRELKETDDWTFEDIEILREQYGIEGYRDGTRALKRIRSPNN